MSSSTAKKRVAKELRWFADHTTCNGFSEVMDSQNIIRTVVWSILIVGGFGATVYHLTSLLMFFLTYPKSVVITEEAESIPFPVVTLCATTIWPFARLTRNSTAYNSYLSIRSQLNSSLESKIPDDDIRLAAVNSIISENAMVANREPGTAGVVLSNLGYHLISIQDIVIKCKYNGKPCNTDNDFMDEQTPLFPKCFKFTPQDQTRNAATNFLTGLELLLYLPEEKLNENFQHDIERSSGVIFYIIDRSKHANYLRETPIIAPVGFYSNTGLAFTYIRRVDAPNDKCNTTHALLETSDKTIRDFQYHSADCTDSIANSDIAAACGCILPYLPITEYIKGYPSCLKLNVLDSGVVTNGDEIGTKYTCMDRILQRMLRQSTINNKCIKACNDVVLSKETSISSLPVHATKIKGYTDVIVDRYNVLSTTNPEFAKDLEVVLSSTKTELANSSTLRDYFVQMNIFVQSGAVTMYNESLSYTTLSFISEIGGVAGLWIGASIMTFAEFFQLAVVLIAALVNRKPRQVTCRTAQEDEEKNETDIEKQELTIIES